MAASADRMRSRIRDVRIDLLYRGGTGIQFGMNNVTEARAYDIVVIMLGGNDIANGASIHNITRRLEDLANALIRSVRHVIITSIWPRQNRSFNSTAQQITEYLLQRYRNHRDITFWTQDRRLSMALIDGTHLRPRAYQRAAMYILSPILWTIRNRLHPTRR